MRERRHGVGDKRWWQKKEAPHEAVHPIAAKLLKSNRRASRNRVLRDMFADEWTTEGYTIGDLGEGPMRRDNVIANAIEAAHSRLAKNQPRPWVVTIGGNFDLTQKAKACTKWLDGEFDRQEIHELGEAALLEAMITGTGCLHVFEQDGLPCVEQVYNEDLHVDPREEQNDCVRTIYRTMAVDRQVLAERFPEHRDDIATAEPWEPPEATTSDDEIDETTDLVLVVAAWHLPAKSKAKKRDDDEHDEHTEESAGHKHDPACGRYVLCVDTATLADEEYDEETFPFEFIHWRKRPRRFWGTGLARAMAGTQAELDGMSDHIAESFHLAVNSIWVEEGAGINVEKIDNTSFRIYTYKPGHPPPQLFSPAPVNPQHLEREETLIRRAYEMQGISQLSAQSQKPAGIDSGKGLRTLNDIETERFMIQARNYERLYVGLGQKLLACAERIVERDEDAKLEVMVGQKRLERLTYRDARMGDQPHTVRVFPASKLSSTPQGRLQDVQDLIAMQAVPPEDARELLDFPDLDQYNTVASAARDLAKQIVEHALDGKDTADLVCPYVDLPYLVKYGTLHHNLAEIDGAPEGKLNKLRAVLGMAESLMQQAAAAAAPPMPPPGGPPVPPVGGPPAPAGAPPGLAVAPPM